MSATQLLVVPSPREQAVSGSVWGDAGWSPPEEREALDWLTLARLSGWSATLGGPAAEAARWIVVARDPDELTPEDVAALRSRLDEPLVVVARAASRAHPLAALAGAARAAAVEGRALEWCGRGPALRGSTREPVETALEPTAPECEVWATLDGKPLVCARRVGAGVFVTIGFHPSRARDADGAVTAILRRVLVDGAPSPAAWLDLECTLVLRMDEPGWAPGGRLSPTLGEPEWDAVGAELLRREARLSVVYAPGRLGEGANGNGEAGDSGPEVAAIAALRTAGLGEVELHGRLDADPDLERDVAALQRAFGVRPTTFVPPGDRFGAPDVEAALRLGFSFVESYSLALRDGDRFLWCRHVYAPYLDLASPEWLAAGLPVVGTFHDGDVASNGIEWVRRHLDAWAHAGVERLIDFRELAAALALDVDLREREGRPVLTVTTREDGPQPLRPIPIRLEGVSGAELDVRLDGRELTLPVARRDGEARVELPAPKGCRTLEAAVRDRDPLDAERAPVGRERTRRRAGR